MHPIAAMTLAAAAGSVGSVAVQLAKLAGAPQAKVAGVRMEVNLGSIVEKGQPLLHLHAETTGELAYALDYVAHSGDIVQLED